MPSRARYEPRQPREDQSAGLPIGTAAGRPKGGAQGCVPSIRAARTGRSRHLTAMDGGQMKVTMPVSAPTPVRRPARRFVAVDSARVTIASTRVNKFGRAAKSRRSDQGQARLALRVLHPQQQHGAKRARCGHLGARLAHAAQRLPRRDGGGRSPGDREPRTGHMRADGYCQRLSALIARTLIDHARGRTPDGGHGRPIRATSRRSGASRSSAAPSRPR